MLLFHLILHLFPITLKLCNGVLVGHSFLFRVFCLILLFLVFLVFGVYNPVRIRHRCSRVLFLFFLLFFVLIRVSFTFVFRCVFGLRTVATAFGFVFLYFLYLHGSQVFHFEINIISFSSICLSLEEV